MSGQNVCKVPQKGDVQTGIQVLQNLLVQPISLAKLPLHAIAFYSTLEVTFAYAYHDADARFLAFHKNCPDGEHADGTMFATKEPLQHLLAAQTFALG